MNSGPLESAVCPAVPANGWWSRRAAQPRLPRAPLAGSAGAAPGLPAGGARGPRLGRAGLGRAGLRWLPAGLRRLPAALAAGRALRSRLVRALQRESLRKGARLRSHSLLLARERRLARGGGRRNEPPRNRDLVYLFRGKNSWNPSNAISDHSQWHWASRGSSQGRNSAGICANFRHREFLCSEARGWVWGSGWLRTRAFHPRRPGPQNCANHYLHKGLIFFFFLIPCCKKWITSWCHLYMQ